MLVIMYAMPLGVLCLTVVLIRLAIVFGGLSWSSSLWTLLLERMLDSLLAYSTTWLLVRILWTSRLGLIAPILLTVWTSRPWWWRAVVLVLSTRLVLMRARMQARLPASCNNLLLCNTHVWELLMRVTEVSLFR